MIEPLPYHAAAESMSLAFVGGMGVLCVILFVVRLIR